MGNKIVKQETIHEYSESNMKSKKKVKKSGRPSVTRSFAERDQTKCKQEKELQKVVDDAWSNLKHERHRLKPKPAVNKWEK
jgi:hypothetical protein